MKKGRIICPVKGCGADHPYNPPVNTDMIQEISKIRALLPIMQGFNPEKYGQPFSEIKSIGIDFPNREIKISIDKVDNFSVPLYWAELSESELLDALNLELWADKIKIFQSPKISPASFLVKVNEDILVNSENGAIFVRPFDEVCLVEIPYSELKKESRKLAYDLFMDFNNPDRVRENYGPQNKIAVEIGEMVSKAEFGAALDAAKERYPDAILLQSRYNNAKHQYSMGLIDYSEFSRVVAQIAYNLLEMTAVDRIRLPKIKRFAFKHPLGTLVPVNLEMTTWQLFTPKGAFIREVSNEEAEAFLSTKPDYFIIGIEAAESIQGKLMYAAETLFGMGHWKESKEEAIKDGNDSYDSADSAGSTSYERDIKIHIKQF